MENTMKRTLTAVALLATIGFSNPALAWGDREQGALAGIVGTLIFQHIQRDGGHRQPAPVIVQQPPVIFQQPQVIYAPAPQPGQIIQCPLGTMPFEQRGWVRNHYNQYIQTTYIECK
jgi:hypothetical protein